MENADAKLGRNLIILIIAIFIILIFFSKHIQALFQNQLLLAPTPFFGLAWIEFFNLIICISFFSIFSVLGYKKAKQKKLDPVLWAVICFVFNIWGYIFLLYKKEV